MSDKKAAAVKMASTKKKPKKADKIVVPELVVSQRILDSLNRVHMRTPKY